MLKGECSIADLSHCVHFAGQGEYDIENWRMVYWRPQKGQLVNPKFGVFCDNWELIKAKYPYLQEQAQGVKDSLASACSYKTTLDWSVDQPFARVCVPVGYWPLVVVYERGMLV